MGGEWYFPILLIDFSMPSQQAEQAYRHYSNGEWTDGKGEETFESENPATVEVLGEFERGTPADIEAALAEVGLAYCNLPCIGAEVRLPFGGVKTSGNGYPSAGGVIEAVTERTTRTLNSSMDTQMAQEVSAHVETGAD